MSNIIKIEFRDNASRGFFSREMKIYFPPVYRHISSMTREQLDEMGAAGFEPFIDSIGYTINSDLKVAGLTSREIVTSIQEPGAKSLVIHHHTSLDAASHYLDGVHDAGVPFGSSDIIVQTLDGYFTMFSRETAPHWNGPTIFYLGLYSTDNIIGFDCWEASVDFEGKVCERELLDATPELGERHQ